MTKSRLDKHSRNLVDYCEQFANLKVSNTRQKGQAPYKPILLLSVIDLIAEGLITENQITVSDELVSTFNQYWQILGNPSYSGGLHYPFFHLKRDNFWHIQFHEEFDGFQPKSIGKLKQAVNYVKLDNELFDFLQNEKTRQELTNILIATWLSNNHEDIESLVNLNEKLAMLDYGQKPTSEPPTYYITKSWIRQAFFRKFVVHIYDYKCAFCGLNISRNLSQNIVDGAHIKPFYKFHNNQINNGISFCKNHHWAFDMGWFSIDSRYRIVIGSNLKETQSMGKQIKEFHGERIFLPSQEKYYPSIESLQWHRYNIFRA
ncbi:HNH endonuclease [Limnospira sp. PMC 289.06]|uniref:HNH endonuclease n=1 Tax=Limnospira sp. PMC 289.06 TaxID=2981094 RepID=UPI0028E1187C|nr:HNH endonuclease [Limnospira sp. PMC 289.06]